MSLSEELDGLDAIARRLQATATQLALIASQLESRASESDLLIETVEAALERQMPPTSWLEFEPVMPSRSFRRLLNRLKR